MSFQHSVYDLFADIKERNACNKVKNDYFKRLSKNVENLPLELINLIKTYIDSYDEETEQIYLNNGLVKTQLRTQMLSLHNTYSWINPDKLRYSPKNDNKHGYTCIMEFNYNKDDNIVLSHRMDRKMKQNRYYIGKNFIISYCDECGGQPKCKSRWYCQGVTETVDHYQTTYVGENLNIGIMMFWSILNEIKNKK